MPRFLTLCCVALFFSACANTDDRSDAAPLLDVQLVADGLTSPIDLTFAPDRSGRRFIVEQNGLVQIVTPDGTLLPTPFLDIKRQVIVQSAFDERGLLALAFHPQFVTNGKFYIHYSAAREGPNICVGEDGKVPAETAGCPLQYTRVVSELRVSANDPNRADPSSERRIFTKQWPGRKHNGGGLAFGPDGMLYIGLGDGGFVHGPSGADDAFQIAPALLFGDHIAQDMSSLYGKILRIDVDRGAPYAIPPDNPWVGRDGIPAEIYAWGWRNPFRIAFDRGGDRAMYVSAPAETLFEATYKVSGPGNYGWADKEGSWCLVRTSAYAPPATQACTADAQCPNGPQRSRCGPAGVCTCSGLGPRGEPMRDPIVEYLNPSVEDPRSRLAGKGYGKASVGGHIYRGKAIPWLQGQFVQGDFALDRLDGQILVARDAAPGKLWTLRRAFIFNPADATRSGFVKSIGQDADGELYAVTGNFTPTGLRGRVWKIVAAPPRPAR
jgi:glucose/arabinose dehydrogenase